ncbi:hypothetical protein QVH35_01035 [Candidatus Nitrosotenuis chungbukensis]|uniref:hypothetical protein n=1 Tax=Candidatus Nitrosotenuis chungbukensis TaxID=1353246 RepID=UPI00267247F1|nr:hypothetical protein [Candidatus Nitrosotenuis chungbukensis]WKT58136.1 hypothetical protein QVH35_01035 [Candidatus Nitrosotenuis chungbukensis]
MNKALLGASILAIAAISVSLMTSQAFAQYMGSVDQTGKTGKNTLEETLKLAKERVDWAKANPSTGSGTPYLAADGVLGSFSNFRSNLWRNRSSILHQSEKRTICSPRPRVKKPLFPILLLSPSETDLAKFLIIREMYITHILS